ncbi:MAG TPA: farnesyl diphosphate synthase [Alphaproteobacteria bacterium]
MAETAAAVDAVLDRVLPSAAGPEARLFEAMRFSTLGGGKRLRPFLVAAGARLFDVPPARAARAGAAVELIHSYSLIHDDLPAMDDDDLRRGRPSCHVQFDEATAILAGDALQALAFEVLADPETHPDAAVRSALVRGLAAAAGGRGMAGGQMIDLAAEGTSPGIALVSRMHAMKTGAIIGFACEAGAILGKAAEPQRRALGEYAKELGLAFQIADDLLDAEGKSDDIGKTAGKDAAAGKATFVSVLGLPGARARANQHARGAVERLAEFDARADLLRAVARFVVDRRS